MNIDSLLKLTDNFEKLAFKSEFTPIEALMQEHATLDRLLLIYDKCLSLIDADDESALKIIKKVAQLIKQNIEGQHEPAEEKLIFKKLSDVGKLSKTIATLIEQHKTSRKLTNEIIDLCSKKLDGIQEKNELQLLIKSFTRMYRSHAAIENTFVFPELRNLMDAKEFKGFSRWFEKKEKSLFGGEEDLEKTIKIIESLEKEVGINKLEDFTP